MEDGGDVLEHGRLKRGYLGIAGQPVRAAGESTRRRRPRPTALLVVGVTDGSPAAAGGVLVGDLLLALDGHPIESPEDLMDLLLDHAESASRVAAGSSRRRGGRRHGVVGERPSRVT